MQLFYLKEVFKIILKRQKPVYFFICSEVDDIKNLKIDDFLEIRKMILILL